VRHRDPRPWSLIGLLLPLLVALVACTGWLAWYTNDSDSETKNLVAQASGADALRRGLAAVQAETAVLVVTNAIDPVPTELEAFRIGSVPTDPAAALIAAEEAGVRALGELRSARLNLPVDVVTVLLATPRGGSTAPVAGSESVQAGAYVRALVALEAAIGPAESKAAVARSDLLAHHTGVSMVRTPAWIVPAALLLLMGLVTTIRLFRALAGVERWVDGTDRGSRRVVSVLEAGRRLATERDEVSFKVRLAAEAKALVGSDAIVLFEIENGRAQPKVTDGVDAAIAVASGEGLIGGAMITEDAFCGPITNERALPSITAGTMAVTPLIIDHRVKAVLAAINIGKRPLTSDDASVLQLLAQVAIPILEGMRHHAANADLVNVDALTGLANRRRLDGDLKSTLPRIMTNGQPVAFAMIDVDHFKKFNDAYGHPAGDALLRQVAIAISAAVRHRDVVYRYGGEEFCVLLPGATLSEARMVAERVRWAVENQRMLDDAGRVVAAVTVSVGVSCRDDLDTSALVADADSALYRAKQQGRNRVVYS
jgi:diguanylate cyclase (GGDEF)-like protein